MGVMCDTEMKNLTSWGNYYYHYFQKWQTYGSHLSIRGMTVLQWHKVFRRSVVDLMWIKKPSTTSLRSATLAYKRPISQIT